MAIEKRLSDLRLELPPVPSHAGTGDSSGVTKVCSTVRPLHNHDKNPDTTATPDVMPSLGLVALLEERPSLR